MATPSPSEGRQKWQQRLSASTDQIRQGVARVQTAPGQQAAAAAGLWQQRVSQSRDKFARNVGAVSLGDWQQAMVNVGIPRVAEGAQAKGGKYERFAQDFYPLAASVSQQVKSMPKGSMEASLARVRHAMTTFAGFRRSGSTT